MSDAQARSASVERKTKETEINVQLDLDGKGEYEIQTGVPFFDHMLESFARHGSFDLRIAAKGDLEVDTHHTVEDVGITLGQALREALGSAAGIRRYGAIVLPMAFREMAPAPASVKPPLSPPAPATAPETVNA